MAKIMLRTTAYLTNIVHMLTLPLQMVLAVRMQHGHCTVAAGW